MTDYLKPSFSVPGPPEPLESSGTGAIVGVCPECGGNVLDGAAHLNQRDVSQKLTRKRVCFGKVVAG